MIWAFTQQLDPLQGKVPMSAVISTALAALPVVVLFYLLVVRRWSAPVRERLPVSSPGLWRS